MPINCCILVSAHTQAMPLQMQGPSPSATLDALGNRLHSATERSLVDGQDVVIPYRPECRAAEKVPLFQTVKSRVENNGRVANQTKIADPR